MRHWLAMIIISVCLAPARASAEGEPRLLWLRNAHNGEELRVRPFRAHGVPNRRAWGQITHLFRRGPAERRTISPRLLRTLVQIQRHFASRRIDLHSGYRLPDEGQESNSYHHVGHAADISIDDIEPRELFEYCRRLQSSTEDGLGCGLYPNRRFVHLDARPRSANWVDLGHHSYVTDPDGWLRENPDAGR